jgi:hypothetical protein
MRGDGDCESVLGREGLLRAINLRGSQRDRITDSRPIGGFLAREPGKKSLRQEICRKGPFREGLHPPEVAVSNQARPPGGPAFVTQIQGSAIRFTPGVHIFDSIPVHTLSAILA